MRAASAEEKSTSCASIRVPAADACTLVVVSSFSVQWVSATWSWLGREHGLGTVRALIRV